MKTKEQWLRHKCGEKTAAEVLAILGRYKRKAWSVEELMAATGKSNGVVRAALALGRARVVEVRRTPGKPGPGTSLYRPPLAAEPRR